MVNLIFKFFSFLGVHLPLPFSYFIGRRLAELRYIFARDLRRKIRKNLKIIMEKKGKKDFDLQKLVKNTFYNFSKYMVDFFNIPKWDFKKVRKKVIIENIEFLDEALSYSKGVIALTAHIGNWELAGIVSSILGYKITAIAIPYISHTITNLYRKRRESKGVEVILTGSNPKLVIKALKENRILAILGDSPFTEKGTEIEFLGKKALFPRGPATLAVKTGAKFVAGFFVFHQNKYRFFFRKIPPLPSSLSEEKKIEFLLHHSSRIIEEVVLEYPDQWFNFSDIWVNS